MRRRAAIFAVVVELTKEKQLPSLFPLWAIFFVHILNKRFCSTEHFDLDSICGEGLQF